MPRTYLSYGLGKDRLREVLIHISVINSLVGGVLAGAVVHAAVTPPDAVTFSAGTLATLLCFWAFYGYERRTWRRAMDAVLAASHLWRCHTSDR